MGILALCILVMKFVGMWWTFDKKITTWTLARQLEITLGLFILAAIIYFVTVWMIGLGLVASDIKFFWVFIAAFVVEYVFLATHEFTWGLLFKRHYPGRRFVDLRSEMKLHRILFAVYGSMYLGVLIVLNYLIR